MNYMVVQLTIKHISHMVVVGYFLRLESKKVFTNLVAAAGNHFPPATPDSHWRDLLSIFLVLEFWESDFFKAIVGSPPGSCTNGLDAVQGTSSFLWPMSIFELSWSSQRWAELIKKHPEFTLQVGVSLQQAGHLSFQLRYTYIDT